MRTEDGTEHHNTGNHKSRARGTERETIPCPDKGTAGVDDASHPQVDGQDMSRAAGTISSQDPHSITTGTSCALDPVGTLPLPTHCPLAEQHSQTRPPPAGGPTHHLAESLDGRRPVPCKDQELGREKSTGLSLITLNVGPVGLAEALPNLIHLFEDCPAMVLLQECHAPTHQIASIRRRCHKLLPHYCLFAHRTGRTNGSKGNVETVTLVHVNLAAQASLLEISQDLAAVEATIPDALARVHFVWSLDPISKTGILVCNCYQYQAGAHAQQQAMLDLITNVVARWKERVDHVILGGDWNASLRERFGYAGTECIARADRRLLQFREAAQMFYAAPADFTWSSYGDRRLATLDGFFSRTKLGNASLTNPITVTCHDPRLDHRAVRVTLSEPRIESMPPLEALRRPIRLNMASWKKHCEEWKEAVNMALNEIPRTSSDPFALLDTAKEIALTSAKKLLGTTGGKLRPAIPFHSSQFIALQNQLRLLRVTHREILSRQSQLAQPPSRAMRRCWDSGIYPKPASFATLSDLWNSSNVGWTREWQRLLRIRMERIKEELDILRTTERALAAAKERDAAINRMFSGRELQRLLHPSPALLHTPLLRSPIPDMLALKGEMYQLSTLSMELKCDGVLTMLDMDRAQVRITRPGCLMNVLSRIRDLKLEVLEIHSSNSIVKSVEGRLEAWEFNLGMEAMATKQKCSQCGSHGQLPVPLQEGQRREVKTWCVKCETSTTPRIDSADYAELPWEIKNLPKVPSDARESLRAPITMNDLDFYLQHLPDNRAPGPDGLPYELLKHAPCLLRNAVRACINAILSGSRIPPSSWLGGLVRFLYKKGDMLDLNNYRPVCLQDAVYKILSAIITDRLYRISERHGLLDPSQEGFRRLHSTQRQVQSLHWAFEEARHHKRSLYCAYLDFKNAFNSVDHEALWRWLTEMNIPDVDLLRSLYLGAHYRAELPYGTTAPIQLFRGTKQGDTLSPLLFGLIFNSLLLALRESGVGYSAASSLHTPARGFADDLALTSQTKEEMNHLLRIVSQFCAWTGMRVNLAKSVITAFDFANNRELSVDGIRYEQSPLVALQPSEAFAYLGIRSSISRSTKREKEHIMTQTAELVSIATRHKYLLSQMTHAMQMVAVARFRYSAPLVPWTDAELDRLHTLWLRVHKAAWTLPKSFPASPFSLPQASGGCPLTHPKVFMIQALTTHVEKLVALPDQIRETAIRKYRQLCEECGCNNEKELSEFLQSERLPRTCPIARLLRTCGQLGIDIRLPRCLTPRKSTRDTSWLGLKKRLISSSEESPYAGHALHVASVWTEVIRYFRTKGIRCPRQLCVDTTAKRYKWRIPSRHPNPRWLQSLRQVLTNTVINNLFPPLDRGFEAPDTAPHQLLVHAVLQACRFNANMDNLFRDERWARVRSSAMRCEWNRELLALSGKPLETQKISTNEGSLHSDPVLSLVELGTSLSADRAVVEHMTRWIAPYLRSISTPHLDRPRCVNPWEDRSLSTLFVEFHAQDETAGRIQCDDFTVSTRHGLVRVERGTQYIGTIKQSRWRLLTQEQPVREVLARLPSWIQQANLEDRTRAVPSQQFWHGVQRITKADRIFGCSPLVAPSVFQILHYSWNDLIGWGWSYCQSMPDWRSRGFVVNMLSMSAVEQRVLCSHLLPERRWFVLTRRKGLESSTREILKRRGQLICTLPVGTQAAAGQGAWRTASLRTTQIQDRWSIWASCTCAKTETAIKTMRQAFLNLSLSKDGVIIPDVHDPTSREAMLGPSGQYYSLNGITVATDGSLKHDGAMGAAFIPLTADMAPRGSTVFGSAMSIRPELTAILMAVEACPCSQHLNILTDSLSSIRLLQNLQRTDFPLWLHGHPMRQIARQLVHLVNQRAEQGSMTRFIKVKAHAGEPLNEAADTLASQAAETDNARVTVVDPERIYFYSRGTLVEWSSRLRNQLTQTVASRYQALKASHMDASGCEGPNKRVLPLTTQWLIRTGQGRGVLGEVLQGIKVSPEKKQILQTIAGTFPCNDLLHKWGIREDAKCMLCDQVPETQTHIQCLCPALRGARIRAHHSIARTIWKGIRTYGGRGWDIREEITGQDLRGIILPPLWYDEWQRMCDDLLEDNSEDPLELEETNEKSGGGLGRKRPDAWAISWAKKTIYILEFTRPNDSRPDWDAITGDYKRGRYQPVRDCIHRSLPTWTVEILCFTMGIRGSYNEQEWSRNLGLFAIQGPVKERLMRDLVRTCLAELTDIYHTRFSARCNKQLGPK